ncbi:MAG: hypothetical protein HYS21_04905 [Deltaproteobacteria bacterium]|nr:hypothetical protein [Deltaproteobacteria bacterium]
MRKLFVAVFMFVALAFTASTASAVVDVEGRYWFTELDDTIKVTSGNVIGTEIDLKNDLGVDDKKNFWEGRITLELGSHKLRYGYMPLKWDGSKNLTQSVVFNGQTYSASADVNSELKMDYHRLGYEYDFFDTLNNRLGVILEVKYFDGDAKLKSTSLGLNEQESFKLPIPTVGITGQVGLPLLLSVGGEVTGVTLGSSAYLVDAEAGINLKPAPFVVISGGYRIFKLHVESDDDKVDLTVKGPFVSLRADF